MNFKIYSDRQNVNYDGEDEALEDNEVDQLEENNRASSEEEDGEDIMENMEEYELPHFINLLFLIIVTIKKSQSQIDTNTRVQMMRNKKNSTIKREEISISSLIWSRDRESDTEEVRESQELCLMMI